ncbi:hypothetical protein H0A65_09715 [Alcaligenaceae bacterium]|nr:hypothetical protein [Alcaligenaceae bacterium]
MLKRTKPDNSGQCETPVSRTVSVGEKYGIQGTPTLIAADGRIHAGAASLASLEAWLNSKSGGKPVTLSN